MCADRLLLLEKIKIPVRGFGLGDDEHQLLAVFLERDFGGDGGQADARHRCCGSEVLEEWLGETGAHEGLVLASVLLDIVAQVAKGHPGAELGSER